MKREASQKLDRWISQPNRKPLVIRGARQTGKTWIVRDLAQRQGRRLIEINFERTPDFASYFQGNDPEQTLRYLATEQGQVIDPNTSLLFLDEIQAAPEVFAALRWFKEEMPGLPVISAGSLLDFVLEKHVFSMPVGRISYLYLEPMSFLEFVQATEGAPLYELLKTATPTTIPDALHTRCLGLYRRYCLCGGMPETVQKWIDTKDINECIEVQTDLLATFRDDFNKYGKNSELHQKITRSVALQLGNKFMLSRVTDDERAAPIKKALLQLATARVVSPVWHTAGNGIPLGAERNEKFFKILMVDIGLVSAQLGIGRMRPEEIDHAVFSNKGALAEQFAGQQIRTALAANSDPELFYWQRTGGRQGEIDYLIQSGNRIVPVEIKSGTGGKMKSLHQFMFDKKLTEAVRFDSNVGSRMTMDVKTTQADPVQYNLLSLPLYLAERVLGLLNEDPHEK